MTPDVANDFDRSAPGLTPGSQPWENYLTKFVPLVSLLGLVAANYYSWTMTATGLLATKLLPFNEVIAPWITPYLVAFFIQTGILSYYLSFPRLSFHKPISSSISTIMFLALIFVTIIFSLFSITFSSQGDNLAKAREANLTSVDTALRSLDRLIVQSYETHLRNLEANFDRACRGRDETGIAKCGPIANGFQKRANDLASTYGGQLEGATPFEAIAGLDVAGALSTLSGNHQLLGQRVKAYSTFATEERFEANAVNVAYSKIAADLDKVRQEAGASRTDSKGLVLGFVFRNLALAIERKADGEFYLSLVIAFLPEFISILCASLLVLHSSRDAGVAQLKGAVREVKRRTRLYNALANSMDAFNRSRRAWFSRRRMANIEEAVDRSVSDTANYRDNAA